MRWRFWKGHAEEDDHAQNLRGRMATNTSTSAGGDPQRPRLWFPTADHIRSTTQEGESVAIIERTYEEIEEQISLLEEVTIVSVTPVGEPETFDLTIEGSHSFAALLSG